MTLLLLPSTLCAGDGLAGVAAVVADVLLSPSTLSGGDASAGVTVHTVNELVSGLDQQRSLHSCGDARQVASQTSLSVSENGVPC